MRDVHITSPADLVALVPYIVEFHPHQCLVSVVVKNAGGLPHHLGTVARLDLTRTDQPARDRLEHLARAHVNAGDSVLVIAYLDEASEAADLLSAARDVYATAAAQVWTWQVSATHARCVGPCPLGPCTMPTDALYSRPAAVTAQVSQGAPAPDRAALGVRPAAAPARRAAARAAEDTTAQLATATPDQRVQAAVSAWAVTLEAAASRTTWPPAHLGRLAAHTGTEPCRDAVLVTVLNYLCHDPAAPATHEDVGLMAGPTLARVTSPDPAVARAPGRDRLQGVIALLVAVAAHAPVAVSAAPLTMAAVLTWWSGATPRTSVLLEQALEADRGYRLALMLQQAVTHRMPPGWASRARE